MNLDNANVLYSEDTIVYRSVMKNKPATMFFYEKPFSSLKMHCMDLAPSLHLLNSTIAALGLFVVLGHETWQKHAQLFILFVKRHNSYFQKYN